MLWHTVYRHHCNCTLLTTIFLALRPTEALIHYEVMSHTISDPQKTKARNFIYL